MLLLRIIKAYIISLLIYEFCTYATPPPTPLWWSILNPVHLKSFEFSNYIIVKINFKFRKISMIIPADLSQSQHALSSEEDDKQV